MTPYLEQEVRSIDYPINTSFATGVETRGTLNDAMLLNMKLRTAHRVHYLVHEKKIHTTEQLYKWIKSQPWEEYIDIDDTITVTSRVHHPKIKDSQFANVRCKDAVVDRFRELTGDRPDAGADRDGIVLYLYWTDDIARIFLDTSGESLSRRGYRKNAHSAPMQETLAAAILKASRWEPGSVLVNPMCGSGTIAIEAALMFANRAPGLLDRSYAFQHINGFDGHRYQTFKKRLADSERLDAFAVTPKIIATDHDHKAIGAARDNAKAAGVADLIQFKKCDFRDTPLPDATDDVGASVIINPEYGERLGNSDQLKKTYRDMGDFFKNYCTDYTGYIFTGNMELAKHVGLRTNQKIPFFNSTIDCRLLEYELYQGRRNQ
jgi:putative N6-adenine-specific DNA methylase